MPNLKKIAVADTADLHLNGADGEKLYETIDGASVPVTVTVYGPGSRQYQAAQADAENRMFDRIATKDSKAPESVEVKNKRQAEFLADTTAGWTGASYDGDPTGRDLSLAIYGDRQLGFIADQVRRFQASWANFSKGSAKP